MYKINSLNNPYFFPLSPNSSAPPSPDRTNSSLFSPPRGCHELPRAALSCGTHIIDIQGEAILYHKETGEIRELALSVTKQMQIDDMNLLLTGSGVKHAFGCIDTIPDLDYQMIFVDSRDLQNSRFLIEEALRKKKRSFQSIPLNQGQSVLIRIIPGVGEESGIVQGGSPVFSSRARGSVHRHTASAGGENWGKADVERNRFFTHERYKEGANSYPIDLTLCLKSNEPRQRDRYEAALNLFKPQIELQLFPMQDGTEPPRPTLAEIKTAWEGKVEQLISPESLPISQLWHYLRARNRGKYQPGLFPHLLKQLRDPETDKTHQWFKYHLSQEPLTAQLQIANLSLATCETEVHTSERLRTRQFCKKWLENNPIAPGSPNGESLLKAINDPDAFLKELYTDYIENKKTSEKVSFTSLEQTYFLVTGVLQVELEKGFLVLPLPEAVLDPATWPSLSEASPTSSVSSLATRFFTPSPKKHPSPTKVYTPSTIKKLEDLLPFLNRPTASPIIEITDWEEIHHCDPKQCLLLLHYLSTKYPLQLPNLITHLTPKMRLNFIAMDPTLIPYLFPHIFPIPFDNESISQIRKIYKYLSFEQQLQVLPSLKALMAPKDFVNEFLNPILQILVRHQKMEQTEVWLTEPHLSYVGKEVVDPFLNQLIQTDIQKGAKWIVKLFQTRKHKELNLNLLSMFFRKYKPTSEMMQIYEKMRALGLESVFIWEEQLKPKSTSISPPSVSIQEDLPPQVPSLPNQAPKKVFKARHEFHAFMKQRSHPNIEKLKEEILPHLLELIEEEHVGALIFASQYSKELFAEGVEPLRPKILKILDKMGGQLAVEKGIILCKWFPKELAGDRPKQVFIELAQLIWDRKSVDHLLEGGLPSRLYTLCKAFPNLFIENSPEDLFAKMSAGLIYKSSKKGKASLSPPQHVLSAICDLFKACQSQPSLLLPSVFSLSVDFTISTLVDKWDKLELTKCQEALASAIAFGQKFPKVVEAMKESYTTLAKSAHLPLVLRNGSNLLAPLGVTKGSLQELKALVNDEESDDTELAFFLDSIRRSYNCLPSQEDKELVKSQQVPLLLYATDILFCNELSFCHTAFEIVEFLHFFHDAITVDDELIEAIKHFSDLPLPKTMDRWGIENWLLTWAPDKTRIKKILHNLSKTTITPSAISNSMRKFIETVLKQDPNCAQKPLLESLLT
jgi:hypothetical protein